MKMSAMDMKMVAFGLMCEDHVEGIISEAADRDNRMIYCLSLTFCSPGRHSNDLHKYS